MASAIGALTNPNKLQKTFKSVNNSKITATTITKYIEYLEDDFLNVIYNELRMRGFHVDVGNLTVVEKSKDAQPVNGYIYSVNLFRYVDSNAFIIRIYWALFISLTITGIVKILMVYFKFEKGKKAVTSISVVLSIIAVLFLAMAREPYAITVTFLLLLIKGILLYKQAKAGL